MFAAGPQLFIFGEVAVSEVVVMRNVVNASSRRKHFGFVGSTRIGKDDLVTVFSISCSALRLSNMSSTGDYVSRSIGGERDCRFLLIT